MNDRRKTKVSIVSYPKSGRTWLRVLIGKALCMRFDLDEQVIFDKQGLAEASGFHLSYTHDDAGFHDRQPYTELATDKAFYAKRKVVLLIRAPRDVLVSCYCHLSRRTRTNAFTGSFSEFVRSDVYGIRRLLTFYNIWEGALPSLPQAALLRYEDLHADPRHCLRSVLEFIGVPDVPDAIVSTAVEYASFGNMKRLEEARRFESRKMRPGDSEDEESYKVRRGVVDGYRDYLGAEDCRYIDQTIAELGCGFYPR